MAKGSRQVSQAWDQNCIQYHRPGDWMNMIVPQSEGDTSLNLTNSSAIPLFARLLREANYTTEAQYLHLLFFAILVIPELGPAPIAASGTPQWPSFMTDDGTPMEIGWDWGWRGSGNSKPTVRYSIEPIGQMAGTLEDPLNKFAGIRLMRRLQAVLPSTNLEWFDHFSAEFVNFDEGQDSSSVYNGYKLTQLESHNSRMFTAFDLDGTNLLVKSYFLPAFKAHHTGKSNLEVVIQAIETLPGYQEPNFRAFTMLREFIQSTKTASLEVEIFAIDCMKPAESRLKGLRGRLNGPRIDEGLNDLWELWNLVFDTGECASESAHLTYRGHRTAGILYYFEIRQGSDFPVPKIYLPVRHYGRNDYAVAQGLGTYLSRRGQKAAADGFIRALKNTFSTSRLEGTCGVQTYIGGTIKDSSLKLISYISPQVYENLSEVRLQNSS
ncbi:uncharacterized protein BP5553_04364 [Venustampulla echinocandica]|uniref:Aromatic prenyltransferase (DMATS family) n=1 Tax=Venustampulla echinocandica TaxID=2656787 RepID=A0A370TN31_9HELO|nr:uncharacterized protein BP5553_04364 [Venustampulla echinocandica]RDL36931.1 hypothetical protein BP5553_04364 [Venustampulla echinocandica]